MRFDPAYSVTYPTKYKRFRVALPRQALRGLHAPIRTNEGLGTARKNPQGRARRRSEGNLAPLVSDRTQAAIMAIEMGLISISL